MSTFTELKSAVKELDSLIEATKSKIERTKARIAKYQAYLDLIESKRTALAIVEVEYKQNLDVAEQKKDLVKERVSAIIDLQEVMNLINVMHRASKIRRASASEEFYKAKKQINECHARLMQAGICSNGFYAIASMNHNRPDRDVPNSVTIEDLLDIREYQKED